ncbi:MAG: hypothetical protein ABI042_16440 [Verrucomicrobiota bacterium]
MKMRHCLPYLPTCLIFIFGFLAISDAAEIEKGTPETPPDANAIAGNFYRGDGTGYNIYLTLMKDGKYTTEWHGCLGKYGEASGEWNLTDKQIIFSPAKEEGMMKKRRLISLETCKFKTQWIFVPTEKSDREFYDKWGVSRYSCFQKTDKK